MQTWPELLADIRLDLDDSGLSPRWSDKLLWMFTKDAIRDYSTWFPLRKDRVELSLAGGKYSLPLDYLEDITVECPMDTYLERRQNRPGLRYKDIGKPVSYFASGGGIYLNSPTDGAVYLTYFASHPVPTSESDDEYQTTFPDGDIELVRLYVKAKVYSQVRGKQALLDRFKVGSGSRDDNPVQPETEDLYEVYLRGIAQRAPGGVVFLYKRNTTR